MKLNFKEMESITKRYVTGCCNSVISIRVFNGNRAVLFCEGDMSERAEHKLNNNMLVKRAD